MTTSINQVRNHMSQILNLREKFIDVSQQSEVKLTTMIETAEKFHTGMQPLKKEVDHLQSLIQKLQYCIDGLSHVQNFYKTGEEVKGVIYEGPGESLNNYLSAMDRIRDSLTYFDKNNNEHVEYSHLSALFSNGLKALQKQFDNVLESTFSSIPSEKLYKLAEREDDTLSVESGLVAAAHGDLEEVSPESMANLQRLSLWLRKVDSMDTVQRFQSLGAARLADSLSRYCDFRKDLMRLSIVRLREYLKNLDQSGQLWRNRVTASNRSLNIVPPNRKCPPAKAYGLVWDANARRGTNETEDFDSEHYNTTLSAFLILVGNERSLLDRLQLAVNSHEAQIAYTSICKGAANELLTGGSTLLRLMDRATARGDSHMILSLLAVLRRYSDLAKPFSENLKFVASLSQPFNDLANRLRIRSRLTLDSFVQTLTPTAGSSQVPPDATVHELASNALLFLEKLMEYESVVDAILVWDESKAVPDTYIEYFARLEKGTKSTRTAFGQYILLVTTAIIANIDKKSESYPESLQRFIFQMNNLRYILRTLESTGLQQFLSNYDKLAVSKFTGVLEELKIFYTRRCLQVVCLTPGHFVDQIGQRKQLDSRERSQMKEAWSNVNQGLANLVKIHSQLSLPDRDLRESLCRSVSSDLVAAYRVFREKSLSVAFTSRREKYVKLTPEEFRARLEQIYASGAAVLN